MKTLKLLPLAFALLAASCSEDGRKDRLVMHYDHPADYFEESLPLGNGRLGALVYGGTGRGRVSPAGHPPLDRGTRQGSRAS